MPQINETILIFYFFAELHLFFPLFGEKNNSRGNQEECEGRAMGPEAVRRAKRWCAGGWGGMGCAGGGEGGRSVIIVTRHGNQVE